MNKKLQMRISLIFAVFVALLVWFYLSGLEDKYKKGAQKVNVLIATKYIEQGTMIKPEMVQVAKVPGEYLQPGAFTDLKGLTGENGLALYMTVVPIVEGEQILVTKLLSLGQETGMASIIPTGYRAFTVACDRASTKGVIRPGNKVDVIASIDYYGDRGTAVEESRTILQNTIVLSVGNEILGTTPVKTMKKGENPGFENMDTSESQSTITLAVTPEEAQILALAVAKGKISFSLRPTGDDRINEVQALNLSKLSGGKIAVTSQNNNQNVSSAEMLQAFKKQQKEALDILNKYKK